MRALGAGLGWALVTLAPLFVAAGCASSPPAGPRSLEIAARTRSSLARTYEARDLLEASGAPQVRVLQAGHDEARGLLFSLLDAVVDDDEARLSRLIAPEPLSIHVLRDARLRPRRLASVRRDASISMLRRRTERDADPIRAGQELLDAPERVSVTDAQRYFGDDRPEDIEPTDLVVTFELSARGEERLPRIAVRRRGMILVRVSADRAEIIGL